MQQVVAQVARASEHARPQGQAVFLETGHPPCLQRAVGEHGDLRGSQRQHDVQAARGDGHGNRRAGAVLCLGVYPDPVQPASLADEFLVDGPRHPHSPVPVGIQAGGGVLGRVDQHRPLRGQGELRVTQLAAHRFGQSAQPSRAAVHRRECGFEQVIAVIKPAQAMGTAHPRTGARPDGTPARTLRVDGASCAALRNGAPPDGWPRSHDRPPPFPARGPAYGRHFAQRSRRASVAGRERGLHAVGFVMPAWNRRAESVTQCIFHVPAP